jgi:DNA segregation ATPase FtsK/SpoIIIE-like protein
MVSGKHEGLHAVVKDSSGTEVEVRLWSGSPHLAVQGPPGSGKTTFLDSLVRSLSENEGCKFILVDGKSVDFQDPSKLGSAVEKPYFTGELTIDINMYETLMNLLEKERRRRMILFSGYSCFSYESFINNQFKDEGDRKLDRIVLVLSEPEGKIYDQMFKLGLEDIYRLGRSVGMHVVLAANNFTQRDLAYFQTRVNINQQRYSIENLLLK